MSVTPVSIEQRLNYYHDVETEFDREIENIEKFIIEAATISKRIEIRFHHIYHEAIKIFVRTDEAVEPKLNPKFQIHYNQLTEENSEYLYNWAEAEIVREKLAGLETRLKETAGTYFKTVPHTDTHLASLKRLSQKEELDTAVKTNNTFKECIAILGYYQKRIDSDKNDLANAQTTLKTFVARFNRLVENKGPIGRFAKIWNDYLDSSIPEIPVHVREAARKKHTWVEKKAELQPVVESPPAQTAAMDVASGNTPTPTATPPSTPPEPTEISPSATPPEETITITQVNEEFIPPTPEVVPECNEIVIDKTAASPRAGPSHSPTFGGKKV